MRERLPGKVARSRIFTFPPGDSVVAASGGLEHVG